MSLATPPAPSSKGMIWTGRAISAIGGLLLLMSGALNIAKPAAAVQGAAELGYPESCLVGLGIATVVSVLLYWIPQTAVLGAILLTGYLGGAVASHVRLEQGAVRIAIPVIFAAFLWFGLYLRDARLRALVPFRRV
jgi:hypothetical protein